MDDAGSDKVEVVTVQSDLVKATCDGRDLEISTTSCSSGRHVLHFQSSNSQKTRKVLELDLAKDDGSASHLRLLLGKARKLKTGGWERIQCETASGGEETDLYQCYRLRRSGQDLVLVLETPPTSDFMASIPDDTPLGEICLPATHDSCAFYGAPFSQCQQSETSLRRQLEGGVRFFDIRLRVKGDELWTYHGDTPQRSSFPSILLTIHDFLRVHRSETLIVSIKEEIPPNHRLFSAVVERDLTIYRDEWVLENRIPRLGEVRGKALLFTRFGRVEEKEWRDGLGIHPYMWPNSKKEGFEWDCAGTTFRIQDWYALNTFLEIPEKFEVVVNTLEATRRDEVASTSNTPFTLCYTSASGLPLAFPGIMAQGFGWPSWNLGVRGINSRLCEYLLGCIADQRPIRACLPMDFYRKTGDVDEDLAAILVAMNFVHR